MTVKNKVTVGTVLFLFILAGISLLFFPACNGMFLSSTSPGRGASGDVFTIHGRNMGSSQGSKIPSINRGRVYRLVVLSWSSTAARVRIPPDLPAGNFKVLIYYNDSFRTSSNSLDFWVTAAPVPASITDPYAVQVRSFRLRYGKSAAWESWMLANRDRYNLAFETALATPSTLRAAFRYETDPIAYDPSWDSEAQHMAALNLLAELGYPGYDFRFIFNGDTAASYVNVVAGTASITSHYSAGTVYLYFETIFNHEFAHAMHILHHYDTDGDTGDGMHMPPGDSQCLMDRTTNQFCSACRTALNLPLDVDNAAALTAAGHEILLRYPY